ncbi:MAG: hypothetical protein M3295_10400, partial [Chloroflexota bacterium]|nr:hypothetical protein [Chloroflexota bacterium]
MLRVASVHAPFESAPSVFSAVETLRLLEAMGLLDNDDDVIERLDSETLQRMLDAATRGGLSPSAVVPLRGRWKRDPEAVGRALDALRAALEDSPAPASEWRSLGKLFGPDRLAALTGIAKISLRRYASGERPTPDDVAVRLHFLAKVTGDLRGAYNDIGVRRWFERPRTALDGRTPGELLSGRWDPDAPDVT